MQRVIAGLTAIVLLISPAYAQSRGKGSKRPDSSQQTEDKKRRKQRRIKHTRTHCEAFRIKRYPIPGRKCASSSSATVSLW
jgi:hypothetical protein